MNNIFENLLWLMLCVYFEAAGEPIEDKKKVGHVILNRVAKSDHSVKDVVLKPWQFSWLNNNKRPPITSYEALSECLEAVAMVCTERLDGKDFFGADHYYSPKSMIPKNSVPSWVASMKELVDETPGFKFYRYK